MLLAVAALEVVINRIAVPLLRPRVGTPPGWHTALDYGGLFLFYMTGVLAALVIAHQTLDVFSTRTSRRERTTQIILAVAAVFAAVPLVMTASPAWALGLEIAFGIAVLALIADGLGRGRDLGVQVGLPILAAPLVLHTASAVGAHFLWPDTTFDGPGVAITRAGVTALCVAALVTPYCFAPRPFTRAVTRPVPVLLAMVIAGIGAVVTRMHYGSVAKGAALAVGVELTQSQADPRLALYLLAMSTLVWTLTSCVASASPARRQVGLGLALVVLGGFGFRWPHHFLLPLLGLSLIARASRTVREEELAALPLTTEAPPVPDTVWAAYIAALTAALRTTLADVHSLTSRGEGGYVSTQIVGDIEGRPVRIRIERIDGAVLALDVVIGTEIEETRGATFTMWALAPRALGTNPVGPPAAPLVKTADPAFDERFKLRGDARVFGRVFDEDRRLRAATTLDGWLAFWDGEGLRYRVYPGRGSPVDHPMPLSDLALGRASTHTERFVTVVALLAELGRHGLPAAVSAAHDEGVLGDG